MIRVLITGAEGMLGSEMVRRLRRRAEVEIIPVDIDTVDLTDLEAVKDCLESNRPTHIIHCAAFTQVDLAEKEPLAAFRVNAEGTKNLAFFARELDAEMIYISTDYVFDGEKGEPYTEDDQPNPINMYGESKLLGEQFVRVLCERHKIVRTSWLNGLGGAHTRNFIETMLRLAEQRSQLSVVDDQVGRPTFTFDLAPVLATLLDVKAFGVFHVTNEGSCTWKEFACRIFELAGKDVTVRPITSDQFRSLARRPRHSVLLNTRLPALGVPPLPRWEEGLAEYFRRRRLAESVSRPESRRPSPDAQPANDD